MPTEAELGAHVVDQVVGDRILRANSFDAVWILFVSTRVRSGNVLRMTYGYSASCDVGDVVTRDIRIDDIVYHRDTFAAAMLHDVADEVDRVSAVHRYHARQRVGDLVLAVVPIAVAIGDIPGCALHGRLATRSSDREQVVVRILERNSLEGQVLDSRRGRRTCDGDQRLDDGGFNIGGGQRLAGSRVVIEGTGRLIEIELSWSIQELERLINRVRT